MHRSQTLRVPHPHPWEHSDLAHCISELTVWQVKRSFGVRPTMLRMHLLLSFDALWEILFKEIKSEELQRHRNRSVNNLVNNVSMF